MSIVRVRNLEPYQAYKNSGVPWLGKVPEHWHVTAFKRIAHFRSGSGFPVNEQGQHDLPVPFFKVSDMNLPANEKFMVNWTNAVSPDTAQSLGATIFPAGSILFPKVGGAMLTNKRRVTTHSSCIDNNLMGCVVRDGNPDFVLATLEYLDMGLICKPGPVPAISEGEVGEMQIALPPLNEQAAIVRHLDDADQRIRAYVSAKERLIALLEEERQAVIQQGVTKGLDPRVKLKPSGVEWLGDVPKHWQLTTVKRHYQVQLGKMLQPRPNSPDDVQVPYLKAQHVHRNHIRIDTPPTMWATPNELERFGIRQGDVLIVEGGAGAGTTSLLQEVTDGYIIQNAIHRVRPRNQTRNELLTLIMEAVASSGWIDAINNKATIPHFTKEKLDCLPITLPPITEQNAIIEYLDRATTDTDQAIIYARRQIDLMEEYRTRLIADVVTGKIDVRRI